MRQKITMPNSLEETGKLRKHFFLGRAIIVNKYVLSKSKLYYKIMFLNSYEFNVRGKNNSPSVLESSVCVHVISLATQWKTSSLFSSSVKKDDKH